MYFISGIWLFVLGVLGAANLIIAKKPDAKELIGKIAPYQGWIGAVSALWGLWGVISAILSLGLLAHWPIGWITFLAVGLVQLALGLLLGVGVLKTFIKQPQAVEKMDLMVTKLAPYQGTLGLISIGLAIWGILTPILFRFSL
jgi:hypothetical protein